MNIGTFSGFFHTVKTLSRPHVSSTQSKYFLTLLDSVLEPSVSVLCFYSRRAGVALTDVGENGRCRSFYPCFINEKAGSLAYKSGKNNLLTRNQEARPEAILFETEHCCWCTN